MRQLFEILVNKQFEYTFFSEKKNYQPYMIDLIQKIAKDNKVLYLSFDKNDKIDIQNVKNIYLGNFFTKYLIFKYIKTKFFLLTMTDLGNSFLKKSKNVKYYIHFFHAPVSAHKQFTAKAFNNYDIVFANGNYQIKELRALEQINNSKTKEIFPTGYMYFDYLIKIEKKKHEDYILFAPSWSYSKDNCLDKYGFKIIKNLIEQNYKVIFRPHPEHFKRSKIQLEIIRNNFAKNSSFIFDKNFSNIDSIQKSKLIITDYSGIAIESFYPFFKPVLYINTEEKIQNDIFDNIEIEAMEDKIRNKFGIQITPDDFSNFSSHLSRCLSNIDLIKDEIEKFYESNFGNLKKVVDKNYNILKKLS